MTETTTTAAPRKKRSRTEVSDDGDKRRGRPRVDRQDASAVDRRRTQIRMAQRAYRQRKESTLEELRKRVSELTNTVELMNKTFLDFSSRFKSCDLSQARVAELEGASLRFESLVRDVRDPADVSFLAGPHAAETSPGDWPTDELEAADLVPRVKNVPSWLDQSAVSTEANRPQPPPYDIGLGYTICDAAGGEETSSTTASKAVDHEHLLPLTSTAQPERVLFSNDFMDDAYDPFPIPSQPSPPRTFSFQESTFARRLHRTCLEKAYQLLLDPDIRPATYERVFRLSLLGRSRAKITSVVKTILARGPHEELDFWHAPLIHVGGAGTHYAPRDSFGNILPKRESRNIGRIGPQTLALLDNASLEQLPLDMTVEIAGYEGEWLDPNDVQGYLEDNGVFIDPSSTFAEVEMRIEEPLSRDPDTTASSMTGIQTANNDLAIQASVDTETAQWNDLFASAGPTDVGFSDAQTGSWMNFLQPGISIKRYNTSVDDTQSMRWTDDWMDPASDAQNLSLVPSTRVEAPLVRREKVVIDVRKLVKALTYSAVCLGRSPGFRRKDIDHALAMSTVEVC